MMREVTPQILQEFLSCDPETGALHWKARDRKWFTSEKLWRSFNAKYSGKEAFTATSANGYKHGVILGRPLKAHRVIWALVHGEWPSADTDHINHDRADNRIANLRAVSRTVNSRNQKMSAANTSGRVGVSLHHSGKWAAQWYDGGKYVGRYFGAFDEACAARAAYELANGYHENHGKAVAA